MPGPKKTIPARFGLIGTEATQTNRFVDHFMLDRLRRNHNWLLAKDDARTILSWSGSSATYRAMNTPHQATSDVAIPSIYLMVPIRGVAQRVRVACRFYNFGSARKVYPLLHPVGKPRGVDTAYYMTASGGSVFSEDSVVIDVPESDRAMGPSWRPESHQLFMFGLIAEPYIGSVVTASAAITAVDDQSFNTASVSGTAQDQCVFVDSRSQIDPRKVVVAGGSGYMIDRPWTITPAVGDTVTIRSLDNLQLYAVSLAEELISDFSYASVGTR